MPCTQLLAKHGDMITEARAEGELYTLALARGFYCPHAKVLYVSVQSSQSAILGMPSEGVFLQADIAYYPFAERFELAMPEFCSFDLHAAGDGCISRWLKAMQERDTIRASMADRSLLLSAFRQGSDQCKDTPAN